MQNYCKTIGALAAASALVAGNASAGIELEYELHTGYTNQYLFRGVDVGENLVEVGADIATEYNGIGLSAGAWYGSYNTTTGFGAGRTITTDTNELDLYAEVSKDFGFLRASVGYIAYIYSDHLSYSDTFSSFDLTQNDDHEVYFSIARDFGFADASFTYYWSVQGVLGGYSELALSRSFELMPCLALNVGTNVSYIFDDGEFGRWNTKVALDWGFVENAKLSPFVALSVRLSDESRYASDSDNELVGGSMLSVSF